MELKLGNNYSGLYAPKSSNCTFMELKFLVFQQVDSKAVCSNCTFMELKLPTERSKMESCNRSNCTFMELKYIRNLLNTTSIWF